MFSFNRLIPIVIVGCLCVGVTGYVVQRKTVGRPATVDAIPADRTFEVATKLNDGLITIIVSYEPSDAMFIYDGTGQLDRFDVGDKFVKKDNSTFLGPFKLVKGESMLMKVEEKRKSAAEAGASWIRRKLRGDKHT